MNCPRSAYIHIPFCRRRCYYCDFPVSVVGDKTFLGGERLTGNNSGTIAHYVDVLCQEICQTPGEEAALDTVFLGGGTPSLLAGHQVQRIIDTLDRQFGLAREAEISMEMDPATFDLGQIQDYWAAGVNRVSLGVQAFQPELLAVSGRSHTVEDSYAAFDLIHRTGFENISLDLISGLPHQTLEQWETSLEKAIALSPTHISCYDLIVEPGTAFSRQYKPGDRPLPSDAIAAEMYRTAQRRLTAAGFEHYEISNYARPGYQCRHNRVYWENRPFYGFGMGAASYLQGTRFTRPRKTQEYAAWVHAGMPVPVSDLPGNQSPSSPDGFSPGSSLAGRLDELLEGLMLGLRLAEGVDLARLIEQFGEAAIARVWHRLSPFMQRGWVATVPGGTPGILPTTGRLQLTDPEGFLFSNVVLTELFEEFDLDSPPPNDRAS